LLHQSECSHAAGQHDAAHYQRHDDRSSVTGQPDCQAAEDPGPPVRGLLAVEGSDFLEGRIDRVQEAFDRGIRSLQLVHYRVNELGDKRDPLQRMTTR